MPPPTIRPIPAKSSGKLVPLPVRGRPCDASAAPAVGPGVVTRGLLVVVVSWVTVVGDTSVVVVVGATVVVVGATVVVVVGAVVVVVVPGTRGSG